MNLVLFDGKAACDSVSVDIDGVGRMRPWCTAERSLFHRSDRLSELQYYTEVLTPRFRVHEWVFDNGLIPAIYAWRFDQP